MIEEQSKTQLPQSWLLVPFNKVTEISSGYGFPKKYQGKKNGDIPFFKVGDISRAFKSNNIFLKHTENYISFNECEELRAQPLKEGSIVFAKIGAAIALNRRAVLGQDSLVDNNVMGIHPTPQILNNLFAFYFMLTLKLEKYSRATIVPSLRKSDVEQIRIPLPPFAEQGRIVSKIEELFTRLDAGVESLRNVKAQLQLYRQTVLNYAFKGKLTEEWRKTHKGEIESSLILSERMHANKDLPPLPESWAYLTLPDIVKDTKNSIKRGPFGSSIKKEYFVPSGYKVYQQKNVIYNDFNWGDYFISKEKFDELKNFELKSGDIVITCSGTIGKIAIVPEWAKKGIINQALLKIDLDDTKVFPEYFLYLFQSKIREIMTSATRGSAMKNISSVKRLKKMYFPIPSLQEQIRITKDIEFHFSVAEEVTNTIKQTLRESDQLRQSILKKAFEGNLVPQDPNDEPAREMLLERIKQGKEKQSNQKKGTKRKKRSQRRLDGYVE